MVKWYNVTLPMLSRGFDYPWPHREKPPSRGLFAIFMLGVLPRRVYFPRIGRQLGQN